MTAPRTPRCGDRTDALRARTADLTLTAAFPARVDRRGDGTFAGTVTVTTAGGRLTGVTSPQADVFLARGGEVVAEPLPKDLIGEPFDVGPGGGKRLAARGTIRPCAAGAGEWLPAGGYDVFAVVVVSRDGGSPVVIAGGPWPVEVT